MNLWSVTNDCHVVYFDGHLIFLDLLYNEDQNTGAQQILIKPQFKTKIKKIIQKDRKLNIFDNTGTI